MREITTREDDDDDKSKDAIPLHSGFSSHCSVRRTSSSLTALHFFRRISDMMFQKVENFQLEQTESFDFQRVTRRRHFSIRSRRKMPPVKGKSFTETERKQRDATNIFTKLL